MELFYLNKVTFSFKVAIRQKMLEDAAVICFVKNTLENMPKELDPIHSQIASEK